MRLTAYKALVDAALLLPDVLRADKLHYDLGLSYSPRRYALAEVIKRARTDFGLFDSELYQLMTYEREKRETLL